MTLKKEILLRRLSSVEFCPFAVEIVIRPMNNIKIIILPPFMIDYLSKKLYLTFIPLFK